MKRCILLLLGICCLLTAPAAIAREWTNKKGKKLQASFVRFEDYDTVILRRDRDGKEFTVKADSLSRKDRTYLSRKRSALGIKRESDSGDPDAGDEADDDLDEALIDDEKKAPATSKKKKSKADTSDQVKIITVVVLIVVNIPIFLLFGKVMFHDLSDFFDCVKYYLTPNWLSWARGELQQDWTQSLKLGVFFLGCAALVFVEFLGIAFFFFT